MPAGLLMTTAARMNLVKPAVITVEIVTTEVEITIVIMDAITTIASQDMTIDALEITTTAADIDKTRVSGVITDDHRHHIAVAIRRIRVIWTIAIQKIICLTADAKIVEHLEATFCASNAMAMDISAASVLTTFVGIELNVIVQNRRPVTNLDEAFRLPKAEVQRTSVSTPLALRQCCSNILLTLR